MSERIRNQVFISYSHLDEKWLIELRKHLAPYIRRNLLSIWDDTQLKAGDKWKDVIIGALSNASVAVLLVSPNFLASDFIVEHELQPLLNVAKKEGVRIIWIAVSASAYDGTEIEVYQAANNPEKPLNDLPANELDKELVRISKIIKEAVNPSQARHKIMRTLRRAKTAYPYGGNERYYCYL